MTRHKVVLLIAVAQRSSGDGKRWRRWTPHQRCLAYFVLCGFFSTDSWKPEGYTAEPEIRKIDRYKLDWLYSACTVCVCDQCMCVCGCNPCVKMKVHLAHLGVLISGHATVCAPFFPPSQRLKMVGRCLTCCFSIILVSSKNKVFPRHLKFTHGVYRIFKVSIASLPPLEQTFPCKNQANVGSWQVTSWANTNCG